MLKGTGAETGHRTSLRTVYLRVMKLKLQFGRPNIRIPLGSDRRQSRINLCRARQKWENQKRGEIVFSDESHFCLDFKDGRILVRRLPTENFLEAFISEYDRFVKAASWHGEPLASTADLNF